MDVFPAIRVVEGDGGQGIDHVEGLEEGGRENFRFWCNIGVTIAVNQPQRVKSCLSRKNTIPGLRRGRVRRAHDRRGARRALTLEVLSALVDGLKDRLHTNMLANKGEGGMGGGW